MIVKFQFGNGFLHAKKFNIIPAMGVGSVEVTKFCDSIWTGDAHLWPLADSKISLHISSITSVKTRSSLNEDDEEWVVHFQRENLPFSYEYEYHLTKIIERLII